MDGSTLREGGEEGELEGSILVDGESEGETDGSGLTDGETAGEVEGLTLTEGGEDGELEGSILVDGESEGETEGSGLTDGETAGEIDGLVDSDGAEVVGLVVGTHMQDGDPSGRRLRVGSSTSVVPDPQQSPLAHMKDVQTSCIAPSGLVGSTVFASTQAPDAIQVVPGPQQTSSRQQKVAQSV